MYRFRKRFLFILLFGLISLGQAYPYAVALAMTQKAQCSCNLSGRKCVHGCDLKQKKNSHSHDHSQMHGASSGHSHHGHHGKHAAKAETKKLPAQETQALWVSPSCSQQTQKEVLSFQGDPFLPLVKGPLEVKFIESNRATFSRPNQDWILACDTPPPKDKTPPAE